MKKKQTPCFLTIYLDENEKQTFSPTRMQKSPPTVKVIDGKEMVFENPDVPVPNPVLGQKARNRIARRINAAHTRKR